MTVMIGTVASEIASRLGLASDTQVIAGTTDSIAAFIATGAHKPGHGVTSLGSSLVLKLVSEHNIVSTQHGVYSHRLGRLWLAGGASNSGGAVLSSFFNREQLRDLSTQIQPDQECSLNYYPLLRPGERFPINDAHYLPRLTPRPKTDIEFLHGLLLGIARIEKQGYDLLHALGAPAVQHIDSAGGGSTNLAWQRLRQKIIGVPVRQAQHSDAAYGSALLAFWGHQGNHPYA